MLAFRVVIDERLSHLTYQFKCHIHPQMLYHWKTLHLISKIMYNVMMYPEAIRMMTRSNKVDNDDYKKVYNAANTMKLY